ncbi:MAG: ASKHA domain-containing protein [Firmicutes bacterium]|nr:ASKHA domain-containing protein [Bacillota bacterium]
MPGKLHVKQGEQKQTISINTGNNLFEILHANGISINAPCGGHGTCGKCTVYTHIGEVLACKTVIDKNFIDTEVRIPDTSGMKILSAYESLQPTVCDRKTTLPYGIAIDIGTTTLAFELLDMAAGTQVATHSRVNSQREFGADVMARITHAVAGAQSKLNAYIIKDICQGVRHIINKAGLDNNEISLVTITGNTTMLHLLLKLPCDTLGVAPFTPVFIGMKTCSFTELFGSDLLNCDVLLLPGISTFVGADISAGMLCAGWPNISGNNLLIDLGTNGEMAIFSRDKIIVTSTAAGPAFEGGNISKGIGSVAGAIAKVSYLPEKNVCIYETIDNAPPIGICGTGVVDISAELVRHGLVDETGQMESDDGAVTIAPGIDFTQRDIREIQLAKSAVRSGIEILLDIAGVSYEELSTVFISGGFGHKIDIKNAVTLGLIPAELEDKVVILGNSALGGCAKVLLSTAAEADILKLAAMATEVNLAAHPKFNELFMEYMGF